MLLLNREDIKSVFTMEDTIEAVKEAFRLFSEGKTDNPLRTNMQVPKENGNLLFMPAYSEELDFASLKIINLFPKNMDRGLPTSFAQVVLMDAVTGEIVAILDGTYVTQLRTGAASGAAFDVLGRKDAKVGALIGTGGQAETQIDAMLAVRKLEKIYVYDRSDERKNAFVEHMSLKYENSPVEIIAAETSDEAVEDADLIATVTPSSEPVFNAAKCKKGVTLSCVGAYQYHMQEMDPDILVRASKIYFDAQDTVLQESGDIIIPLEQGMITEDDFTGELGNVINGTTIGREFDDEIIVFETVGIGTQDLITAKAIYERALEKGIGTKW